jgi:hypothetical protein
MAQPPQHIQLHQPVSAAGARSTASDTTCVSQIRKRRKGASDSAADDSLEVSSLDTESDSDARLPLRDSGTAVATAVGSVHAQHAIEHAAAAQQLQLCPQSDRVVTVASGGLIIDAMPERYYRRASVPFNRLPLDPLRDPVTLELLIDPVYDAEHNYYNRWTLQRILATECLSPYTSHRLPNFFRDSAHMKMLVEAFVVSRMCEPNGNERYWRLRHRNPDWQRWVDINQQQIAVILKRDNRWQEQPTRDNDSPMLKTLNFAIDDAEGDLI